VRHTIEKRSGSFITEITGTVEGWEVRPTGSWFAHDRSGRLPLERLKLRKADGELVLLVIDATTEIEQADGPGT
jgi:hypothetical protein